MPSTDAPTLDTARAWLRDAARVVVLTGAGVSQESGVPTFRDAQTGLWARFRPEDLATESAFRADPARVWDWYAERRAAIALVQPNAGHQALARYAERHPGKLTLVTQNVDGLHQRAGSVDVLALHGNIFEDRWLDPCAQACATGSAEPGRPPCCARCGNRLRPGVVWFGEMLPHLTLARAESAARDCDLMLVVGTSGQVYPAAGLAHEARAAGARVLILNPDDTGLDGVAHLRLRGTAAALLPQLLKD
ncbi:MAG TPA: NAD-dependent deacylase [Burkholderiaceae bacterium]|nr:NAD-dependent deacylase [Burkholderiaceae bacterium]